VSQFDYGRWSYFGSWAAVRNGGSGGVPLMALSFYSLLVLLSWNPSV